MGSDVYACNEEGTTLEKTIECPFGCTSGACHECQANATDCNLDELVVCGDDGTVQSSTTCDSGCQAGSCNDCQPDTTFCQDGNAMSCGADGTASLADSCTSGCVGGVCNECSPSTVSCSGDTLVNCDATGEVASTEACELGCVETANDARCASLVPLYGVPAPSGQTEDLLIQPPPNEPTVFAFLDLGNCGMTPAAVSLTVGTVKTDFVGSPHVLSVAQTGAPAICIVRFRDISIAQGVSLHIFGGPHMLSLQAEGSFELEGTITFRSTGAGPAPGTDVIASSHTLDGTSRPFRPSPGAGGGGNQEPGGTGGKCVTTCGDLTTAERAGGAGGGVAAVDKLYGGSRGGHVTIKGSTDQVGRGGGGGGGLHIVALSSVSIAAAGRIQVGGLGGASTSDFTIASGIAGGGGSGGTVVIEAPEVTLANGAIVAANGGGGAGGCRSCSTQFGLTECKGKPGQSGILGTATALGGDCGGAGNGGAASTGAASPTADGASADSSGEPAGGGGGGGNGYVILRGRSGTQVTTAGAVVSPAPSVGSVTAQ